MHKSERLGLLLTPEEKSAAEQLAEAEGGLSLAAIVRRLIRKAAREHGLWPPPVTEQSEVAKQCEFHRRA